MGGHQINDSEPGGEGQLGVMYDGSGAERGLAAAAATLIGPGLGFQPPGFATTAARADKSVRPACRRKVMSASRLVAKALLELDQGTGKVGHQRSSRVAVFTVGPTIDPPVPFGCILIITRLILRFRDIVRCAGEKTLLHSAPYHQVEW